MASGLLSMPLTPRTVHLCVDMQRIFAPGGPWSTAWMPKVHNTRYRCLEVPSFIDVALPHWEGQGPSDRPGAGSKRT